VRDWRSPAHKSIRFEFDCGVVLRVRCPFPIDASKARVLCRVVSKGGGCGRIMHIIVRTPAARSLSALKRSKSLYVIHPSVFKRVVFPSQLVPILSPSKHSSALATIASFAMGAHDREHRSEGVRIVDIKDTMHVLVSINYCLCI